MPEAPSTILTPHLVDYGYSHKKVWAHDRTKSVGASEVGLCMRRVWYTKSAVAHDPEYMDRWGATLRGSVYEENVWFPSLRKVYGEKLRFAGPAQQTFFDSPLSATPDGLIVGRPTFVAECKTLDPRSRLRAAKPEHVFQVQVSMGVIRKSTHYNPEFAIITYTDASHWDVINEYRVEYDPDVYSEGRRRASKILAAKCPSEMIPEGIEAGGKECQYCPFQAQCKVTEKERESIK